MSAKVTKAGTYELSTSEEDERILELEDEQFIMVKGPKGEDMLAVHGEFKQDDLLDRGEFKLFEFDAEDKQDDLLLLQRNNHFQIVIVAQGLPTGPDEQVLVEMTEERIGLDEVLDYVTSLESGSGGTRRRTPRTETFIHITHHLGAMGFPAEKRQIMDFARRMQAPDQTISLLASLQTRNYHSIRDVRAELGDVEQADELGIRNQSADEVIELIEAMEPAELRKLQRFEQRHDERQEILDAIDKRLNN